MPQDYRRFNGPEDSIPYQRFTKDFVKSYDERYAALLDSNEKRKDGRTLDEARSISKFFATTKLVSQAKGSCYLELKKTKVVCSVFDPREIPHQSEFSGIGQLYCEVKFAPFACRGERRSPVPDAEEKALSEAVKKALEACVCLYKFPNFQIDIFVYILENDGACLACAINSAGLALADAAVPMCAIITSTSLAVIGDKIFVDANYEEEQLALANTDSKTNNGIITISTLPDIGEVLSEFRLVGSMDVECIEKAIEILERECRRILYLVENVIVSNVKKSIEEKKWLEEEEKKKEEILVQQWKISLNEI